ncbi:MAG: hypothetical protein QW275_02600, partial [Candidatus Anstonellaceae archaeon]
GYEEEKRKTLGIGTLPASLEEASKEFESDSVLTEAMGAHITERLLTIQRKDWDGYRTQVTPWEKERYFGVL